MLKILLVSILIISINYAYDSKISNFKDKRFFELILDRFEVVFETTSIMECHTHIKKVNKTRSVVGYLMYYEPIGNNFKIGIKVLKKQGGEYRYMPYFLTPAPFCDTLTMDNYTYSEIARQSDLPEDIKNNCPLQAGNYSVYGLTFDLDRFPTKFIQTGEYASEMTYYKDEKEISIYRFYAYVNNV